MAVKVPIRTVYDNSNNAVGLSEFQSGEAVGYQHGGTGLNVIGSANQILKVNSEGTAIEWAADAQSNLDPYLQVANANITFVTKSTAVASNNALINLINDRMQVANVQTLVTQSISDVLDGAPGALDTLNEIAAAIGDDANFITTITNDINNRLSSNASLTLSGDVSGTGTFSSNALNISVDIQPSGTPTGTFGSASQVPVIVVGADGRITGISNTAVAGVDSVSYNTSNSLLTINTSDGGSQTTNITLQPFSTTNLIEGTNQYFTTARARESFTAGSGIAIAEGVISQATEIDYGLITGAVGANTIDYGSII